MNVQNKRGIFIGVGPWLYFFYKMSLFIKVNTQCSSTMSVTSTLNQPNFFQYPESGSYGTLLNCSWLLSVDTSGNDILIRLGVKNLGTGDFLKLYKGPSSSDILFKTENNVNSLKWYDIELVAGGNVFVELTSDAITSASETGFIIYYISGVATDCNTGDISATTLEKRFGSPNFPAKYPTSNTCLWNITGDTGCKIQVDIIFMDIEKKRNGCYDTLSIYDSDGTTVLTTQCQENYFSPSLSFTSTSNTASVQLYSDNANGKRGFIIACKTTDCSTTSGTSGLTTTEKILIGTFVPAGVISISLIVLASLIKFGIKPFGTKIQPTASTR